MICLTKLFQQKRRRIGYILAFSTPTISKRDSSDFFHIFCSFNAVAADLRQKSSIFAPDLKQMRMFRRNIISKLEAWKQDKKHKKSPARNRVGDVCVIKLTLCQLQRADALSYLLNGTIENAFLLCIERVNITTNLWAVETLREPCCTFAEVFLCDHCLSRNGAWTQKHSWYGCWHEWQFRFLVQRLTWQLLVP